MQCSGSFHPGTAISQCRSPRLSSAWCEMSMFSALHDREAAHDRVAVVPVLVARVHAVGGVLPFLSQELVLAPLGPRDMTARMPQMGPLHFLQEHHVGGERMQPLADLVHHQAAVERGEVPCGCCR